MELRFDKRELSVGEVVVSPEFVCGERRKDSKNTIWIEARTDIDSAKDETYQETLSKNKRIKIAAKTGKDPGPYKTKKLFTAYDKSRGTAEFVVEEAIWDSSESSGPYGGSASTQIIQARRLNTDGTYNPPLLSSKIANEACRYRAAHDVCT